MRSEAHVLLEPPTFTPPFGQFLSDKCSPQNVRALARVAGALFGPSGARRNSEYCFAAQTLNIPGRPHQNDVTNGPF
jgi:hypothetical protein